MVFPHNSSADDPENANAHNAAPINTHTLACTHRTRPDYDPHQAYPCSSAHLTIGGPSSRALAFVGLGCV